MANLSQIKRQKMLDFLNTIRDEHKNDESVLIAINEIENELTRKKYGLVWEEHDEAVDTQMKTKIPVFSERKDRIINILPGEGCNFILEGDNLHSLKLLEKACKRNIDVIIIDPPYNTGNKDFIYNDTSIDQNDGYRHSKWLSFMERRLKIAKNLLNNTGCIMIHINDIEYAALKLLCDDIFGEQNFVASFIWKSRQNKDNRNRTGVSVDHEYILTYEIEQNYRAFKGGERDVSQYENPDNDPKGAWASANMVGIATEAQRPNLHYDLIDPNTGINYGKPAMGWRYDKKTMARLINENLIIFPNSPEGRPRRKKYLSEVKEVRPGFSSIIGENIYTKHGTNDINKIFGYRAFDFPKPVALIKEILSQTTSENSIILDFFAGSGTTGQAVLELNKEDGGNRRFILCTNNENSICENVTYPRIKTVITGIRLDGSQYSEGIPANLKYYETDYVLKNGKNMPYDLIDHIREMVQLEHGIDLDDRQYVIIMDDDAADDLEENWEEYQDLKGIYMSSDVLLTAEQQRLFESVELNIIPEYYFEEELREAGQAL